MNEEYQLTMLSSLLGGWESVNGNPDVYIYQDCDGEYYLLACYFDKDYGRTNFTCYHIDSDEDGLYIGTGTKQYRLMEEKYPYGLHIGEWGSYMKN
jgi:hypothetical protein